MQSIRQSDAERLLAVALVVSLIGNIVLMLLFEQSGATQAYLEVQLNHSALLSPAAQAEIVSGFPPVRGQKDAPITVVLFSDFQCPYCRRFSTTLLRLNPEQKRLLRVVFREFPLPMHRYAKREAEIAACTARQSNNAFWALYDYFYRDDPAIGDPTEGALHLLKGRPDIDNETLSTCVNNSGAAKVVAQDIELGTKYGVHGTPTLFVNGRRLIGDQYDLGSLIESMSAAK